MKKRNYISFVFLVIFCFASCSFISQRYSDPKKEQVLLEVLKGVLQKWYYNFPELDDTYSQRVFQTYISNIDSQKRYFLQSDIEEFKKYENLLDDNLKNLETPLFDISYPRLLERLALIHQFSKEIMQKPFDFLKDEDFNTDFEKESFVKDEEELKDRWRKILKFTTLSNIVIKQKEEKAKKAKNIKYQEKTFEQIQKEAEESTAKVFDEMFLNLKDLVKEDWFATYVDSYTLSLDPHTNYFSPDLKENFKTRMSGKFEGIGAQLQKTTDGLKITNVILGGPVWKIKALEVGDLILKVAEAEKEPVDIIGMRMDEAIKLIKGPKGTEVRLTVKRVDGNIEVVSIIRDVVELEETFVKSTLIKYENKTYGLVRLPSFYIDFDNPNDGKNSDSDMEKELLALNQSKAQGVVIDLRDNGGGSLKAVINIVGMFIDKGPVVQVGSAKNRQLLSDQDSKIIWNKPVVILINELSASASEILAAALQDYKRAIIVGSKQSFGKGTVQNVVDFDNLVRSSSYGNLGSVKFTTEKFYRINGGATQLEGVKSDIILPDKYKYIKVGERELKNPIPWDEIEPTEYKLWSDNKHFSTAIANSQNRIKKNSFFDLIDENARWIETQKNQNIYSLNYQKYKEQVDLEEEKSKKFKGISEYKSSLKFISLPKEEEKVKSNEDFKLRRDRWHESLQKDLYVEESIKILKDLIK